MATFEKRPTGWRVKIRKGGVSESKTFATKAQASAWAADRERELDDIAAGGAPKKTFREALERYLADESPKKRGHSWEAVRINSWMGREDRNGEPSKLRVPWLDVPLADLGAEALAAWRDARLKNVAPGSVLRELNLMGAVLETARREWKWIRTNPLRDVRRPSQPEARTRRIMDDEIARICLALGWDDEPVTTQTQEVAAAFLLAIETAMRQGEILGLTWDSVDVSRRVAHLPKTKNGSARDVPLTMRAVQILELMRGRGEDRIFTVSSASADALFRKGKARAMVEGLHFHDTRREATSRLAKKVDVLTLARITGHKDIRMLMIYYQTDMADVAQQIG